MPGGKEAPPGGVVTAHRCRWDAQPFEDPADRGRTHAVTEVEQVALDSLVSPAAIISGHLFNQSGYGQVGRWASRSVRLVDATDGALIFRHDLVREAVYTGIGDAERRRLHQRFATHLIAAGSDLLAVAVHARAAACSGDIASARVLVE